MDTLRIVTLSTRAPLLTALSIAAIRLSLTSLVTGAAAETSFRGVLT